MVLQKLLTCNSEFGTWKRKRKRRKKFCNTSKALRNERKDNHYMQILIRVQRGNTSPLSDCKFSGEANGAQIYSIVFKIFKLRDSTNSSRKFQPSLIFKWKDYEQSPPNSKPSSFAFSFPKKTQFIAVAYTGEGLGGFNPPPREPTKIVVEKCYFRKLYF